CGGRRLRGAGPRRSGSFPALTPVALSGDGRMSVSWDGRSPERCGLDTASVLAPRRGAPRRGSTRCRSTRCQTSRLPTSRLPREGPEGAQRRWAARRAASWLTAGRRQWKRASRMHAPALLLSLVVLGAPAKVLNQAELQAALQRFVVTPLSVDVSKLPPSERKALARLVQAARVVDPLFLRQSWADNEAWLMKLA